MSSMRVLYFSQEYTGHDYRFLEALGQSRLDVHFLRLSTGPPVPETRALPEGVKPVAWPKSAYSSGWRGKPARFTDFKKVLADVRPDVVHAGPVQTCGFLAAASGFKPLLLMSWGSDILLEAGRSFVSKLVTQFTLGRSSMVQCDCLAVRDKARSLRNMPASRFVTFPWGVDLKRFNPECVGTGLRRKLGWEGNKVVISTRSFEPIYGTGTLLEAVREVCAADPAVRVLMLGTGSQHGMVREFITQNGLSGRVHLAGRVDNDMLPGYLREADLYVSASLSDGTSVSLLEAMASGLPAVVSDLPSNREWIQPLVNGWLVPKGDASALAQGIERALEDEHAWPGMAAANVETVRQRADWERNFPLLLEAYESLTHSGLPQMGRAA